MRIILTHEQADFDALASLLGANLLDEAAVPVLPRRQNRNVRAFVTLYGQELPFLDPRDLPPKNIESATLVDTQSPITIKGMTSNTRIQVIDHHPARPDMPDDWIITKTGRKISPRIISNSIQVIKAIKQYDIIQKTYDTFTMRVEADKKSHARIKREVPKIVSKIMKYPCKVKFKFVDKIPPGPGGKVRKIMSKVKHPN